MILPTRRRTLAGLAAAAARPLAPAQAASWSPDSLQAAAARKGLAYGSAVNITPLRRDPAYGAAIARECGIVTAENAMKMEHVLPDPGRVAFQGGDETLRFAAANGQGMRGHCLVWHRAIPDWVLPRIATAREAEEFLRRWIDGMAHRYRGRIEAWDVVNEILAPQEGRADGLRHTPWLAALGPAYIDLAFGMLRDTDPKAVGVWNEDDCELGADWIDRRRALVLKTLDGLLKRGVPVRRFGMQGHLDSTIPLDATALRAFLREIAGRGLAIEITEFDVDDRAFPAAIAARDRGVADRARAFLDVVLDEAAVLNVVSWDITNAGTWLNHSPQRKRTDGLAQRALPLDAQYRRTPLWQAMRRAFEGAPDHRETRARLRRG